VSRNRSWVRDSNGGRAASAFIVEITSSFRAPVPASRQRRYGCPLRFGHLIMAGRRRDRHALDPGAHLIEGLEIIVNHIRPGVLGAERGNRTPIRSAGGVGS
jgi:hypothetical protein